MCLVIKGTSYDHKFEFTDAFIGYACRTLLAQSDFLYRPNHIRGFYIICTYTIQLFPLRGIFYCKNLDIYL